MIIYKIIFLFLIIFIFNSILVICNKEINIIDNNYIYSSNSNSNSKINSSNNNNNNNNNNNYLNFKNNYKNKYSRSNIKNKKNHSNNSNNNNSFDIIINENEEGEEIINDDNQDLYKFKNSNINYKKSNHNYQDYKHLTNNTNPICNQNTILKDWGFQNLQLAFQENNFIIVDNYSIVEGQYWKLIYPVDIGVNISFVDQLQEAFFSTSIQGYSAIKISSVPGKPLSNIIANIYLNQTFQVAIENDYQIMFEVSSTQVRFILYVFVNDHTILQIEPTGATFDRVPYRIPLLRDYLTQESTVSIELSYFDEGLPIPPTYIENVRIVKIPNDQLLNSVFVSNNGSDVTGDGTSNYPFSSIQQAIYYLADNSNQATVFLHPGYYCGLGNSYLDFSSVSYLTLTSLSSVDKPTISGEYFSTSISFSTVSSVNLLISNINFIKSSVRPGGSSIAINGNCTLRLDSCQFDQHYGDSVVHLNYLTFTHIDNCLFLNNTQYAIEAIGVFGLDQITISSSTFYSINSINILNINFISVNNSNFYYNNNTPMIDQQQCPILLDIVYSGNISNSLINTAVCIYRSVIQGNSLVFNNQPSNIYIQAALLSLGSHIDLVNITFSPTIHYSCISAFEGLLDLKSSVFNQTGSKNSIIIENTELFLESVQFLSGSIVATRGRINGTNLNVVDSFFITASSTEYVEITNSTLISVTNFLVQTKLYTSDCIFINSGNYNFELIETYYQDYNSFISNNSMNFVFSSGDSTIMLSNTVIENNSFSSFIQLENGGAVNAENIQFNSNIGWGKGCGFLLGENTILKVYNSTFNGNSCSGSGGIVNIQDFASCYLKDCVVTQNTANDNGGVIYSGGNNNITIDGGFYLQNTLRNGSIGVFIFYYDDAPLVKSNVVLDHLETVVLGKINIQATLVANTLIPSGSGPYKLLISFINSEGKRLTGYEFEKSAHLYISLTGYGVLQDISLYKLETQNGSFIVIIDQLIGQINTAQTIFINSDSPYILSTQISFQFEPCQEGYYPNERNTLCIICPYGTYGMNSQCESCPENTICYGGATVAGLDGYWVYTNGSTLKVYECPADVCYKNDLYQNTTCAPYSDGLLCADCVKGYYNCGSGCKKETSINKFVLMVKIVMFFVLVITQQWSSDNSGLVTIALYFMQTLAVISSGIKFSILTNLSGSNTAHSGRSNSIFSVLNDCLGPFGFYWNHYFIILQPIFLFVVLLFIILLELLLRKTGIVHRIPLVKDIVEKTDKEFFNRQFSTFIKVCMNSYGPFATEVLLILFCEQVGPLELLNANPAVTCNGQDYDNARKITYSLISILVLFPFIIFILLYRIKNRLDDKDIERIYGVFYLKYVPKLYFWDVTLLLKRLSIVTVSLIQFQSNYRSVILVTLALIYLFVHLKFQPFITDQDNNLETVSLILLFISCIYLDNGLYQDTEQWILIICVVSFLLAAIKFQSKYIMNEFNKKIYPILKSIYDKVSSNSSRSSLNGFSDIGNQYKVLYEESDNEDDEISNYAYDSQRNVIKVIDKSNYYNFVGTNSSPGNQLSSSYTYGDDDSDNDDYISNQIKRRI